MYEPRLYRSLPGNERFCRLEAGYLETDLWIAYAPEISANLLREFIVENIIALRADIDEYNRSHPGFSDAYSPLPVDSDAPVIVQRMLNAALKADVGPMAAVAGAFAGEIGRGIKNEFLINEIIVENGGDIYIDIEQPVLISIFAGDSPLSNKIALEIPPEYAPLGVCTSSGKVGHSRSFGQAHAVTIACKNTAEADAFATAFGNKVQSADDIDAVVAETQLIQSILSALVIVDDKVGIQGKFNIRVIEQ